MAVKTRAGRREQRSRRIRQKIYDVAMELFSEKGFDNVKVTEICDKANVSVGSFYHFYPSKEHLLLAFTDAVEDYFNEVADDFICESAIQTLHNIVRAKLKFLTQSGPSTCQRELIASVNHHDGSPLDLKQDVYRIFETALLRGMETGEFREDIEPERVTSLLRYLLGGLFFRWCLEDGSFDIFEEADKELSNLIGWISKAEQESPVKKI